MPLVFISFPNSGGLVRRGEVCMFPRPVTSGHVTRISSIIDSLQHQKEYHDRSLLSLSCFYLFFTGECDDFRTVYYVCLAGSEYLQEPSGNGALHPYTTTEQLVSMYLSYILDALPRRMRFSLFYGSDPLQSDSLFET